MKDTTKNKVATPAPKPKRNPKKKSLFNGDQIPSMQAVASKIETVEEGHTEEISKLRSKISYLENINTLLYRDLEHISYLCTTAELYLNPGDHNMLIDGDELENIIHFINIIVLESERHELQ